MRLSNYWKASLYLDEENDYNHWTEDILQKPINEDVLFDKKKFHFNNLTESNREEKFGK